MTQNFFRELPSELEKKTLVKSIYEILKNNPDKSYTKKDFLFELKTGNISKISIYLKFLEDYDCIICFTDETVPFIKKKYKIKVFKK